MDAKVNASLLGPASYRNWRAFLAGEPSAGLVEVPLYSDAKISGGAADFGPYRVVNAHPATDVDARLMLRIDVRLREDHVPPANLKTDTTGYTGARLADEIAALLSLAWGVRITAGAVTRYCGADGKTWVVGDRARPASVSLPAGGRYMVPSVRAPVSVPEPLTPTFIDTPASKATALVRASRSYRDALWVADGQPALAWLFLVTALEVAAVDYQLEGSAGVSLLEEAKPELVEQLRAVDPRAVELVAAALEREQRATARFRGFVMDHLPEPPTARSLLPLDWGLSNMRKLVGKVYAYRSLALHEGIPFPPPLCQPPVYLKDNETPLETFFGVLHVYDGGQWSAADLPFPLHIFEHITRGALHKWWQSLRRASS